MSQVTNSRPTRDGVRRRRECSKCQNRWTTWEVPLDISELVGNFKAEAEALRKCLTRVEAQVAGAVRRMNGKRPKLYEKIAPELSKIKYWSPEDDARVLDLAPRLGIAIAAERLGRTKRAVQTRLRDLRRRRRINGAQTPQAENGLHQG